MARKKKGRRKGPKTFRILNALESLTYAQILMKGTTGTGIGGFLTGEGDLGFETAKIGFGTSDVSTMVGHGEISLADLMSEPGMAVTQMASNFQNNLIPMAAGAFGVSVGFRIGRRLLRKPIANINRNLVVPALGRGIAL